MNAVLFRVHVRGDARGERTVDAQPGMTIGRATTSSLCLEHPTVSNNHGRVELRAGRLVYVDHSRNGTLVVDGELLTRDQAIPLEDGLELLLGDVQLGFRAAPAPAPPALPPRPPPEPKRAPAERAPAERPLAERVQRGPDRRVARDDAPPVPAEPPSAKSADPSTSGLGTLVPVTAGAMVDDVIARLDARLLVAAEGDRRIVPITTVPFLLGRSSRAECRFEHVAVSKEHARIDFDASHYVFRIEDLGSANRTRVGQATLTPGIQFDLGPDAYLRIGTLEIVFAQSLDRDFVPVPSLLHERALRLLVARGKVRSPEAARTRERARAERRPLVDVVISEGLAGARDWCDAVAEARQRGDTWLDRARLGWAWVRGRVTRSRVLPLVLALGTLPHGLP